MRAISCESRTIRVVDVPPPSGDGVRVRVRACGICGSDLHMLGSDFPLTAIPGHEIAGEVDGRPVAIEPLAPCEACEFCATGDYQLCTAGPAMVFGVGRDGGMAEEILVPERALVPLPSHLPLGDASLVEPLAVAVHGLRKLGSQSGARLAVVGGGAIGLCAVAVAAAGGSEVGLVARHAAQRAAGERLGASEASGEYPIVIDAAGTSSSLQASIELMRPGGTVLLLSSFWDGVTLDGMGLAAKEATFTAATMYGRSAAGRDFDLAVGLLASRPEIADAMITHRLPLEAAPEAFAIARDRKAGSIKVVLEP